MSLSLAVSGIDSPKESGKHSNVGKPPVGDVENTHYAETEVESDVDHLSLSSQLDDLSDQKEEIPSSPSYEREKVDYESKYSVESDDDEDYTEVDTSVRHKIKFQPKTINPFDILLSHTDTSTDEDDSDEWSPVELENYTLKNRVRELEQKQYMAEKFLASQATLNGIVYHEVEENVKFREAHAEKISLEDDGTIGSGFTMWNKLYRRFFAVNPRRTFKNGLFYSFIESTILYYLCYCVLLGPIGESSAFLHGCFAVLRGTFVGGALLNYFYNGYLFFTYGWDEFVLRSEAFTTRAISTIKDYYNHYRRVTVVWEHVKTWSKYVAPVAGVSVVVGATYYVYKSKSGSNAEKKDQNRFVSKTNEKQSILVVLVGLLSIVVYWNLDLLRATRSGIDFMKNFYIVSNFFGGDRDQTCVNAGISCNREHKGKDRCQDCVFDSLERIYKKVVFKTDPTFVVTHIPQTARVLAQTLSSGGDTKWFDELPEILKTKVLAFIGLTYEDYLAGEYSICVDEEGQVYLRMIKRKFFMRSATPSPNTIRDSLRFIDNQPVRMTRESAANAERSRQFLMNQSLEVFEEKENNQVYDPVMVGSIARMEQMADESAKPTREQLSEFSVIGERLQTCFESDNGRYKYLLVTNVSNRWVWLKSKIIGIPVIGKRLDYIFAIGVLMAIFLVVYLKIDSIKSLFKTFYKVFGKDEDIVDKEGDDKEEVKTCREQFEEFEKTDFNSKEVQEFLTLEEELQDKYLNSSAHTTASFAVACEKISTELKNKNAKLHQNTIWNYKDESKRHDDEFKKKFSAARDRKMAGQGTYDKADKTRVKFNPDKPRDRVEKIRMHEEDVDLPKVNNSFVVYDDPVKILSKLKGIPMQSKDGTVRQAKSIEEFNRLKNAGNVILLNRLPVEYVKAHIEVSRPDVWPDFERFKIPLKDVLRKKEGWEKFSMGQGDKSDLFELLSSGDIKPDADARKAIQFLLGFGKKNEANIELPKEVKKEHKPETVKALENIKSLVTKKTEVKKSVKKEEVNVPCPAELVPGRPQCKVKGCTFIHSSIKKNEVHVCPQPVVKMDEAKVEGKPLLKVSGNNAFAIVYKPDYGGSYGRAEDFEHVQEISHGVSTIGGCYYYTYDEEGTKLISDLKLTGTACWVKKHFVTAAHVFTENKGQALWIFDHEARKLSPINNVRSMIDRDVAIFTTDYEFMSKCQANFSRHRAIVADHNTGRKGVTLVKVDHFSKMPYCETGNVKSRNDVLGELSYDVMTQYGDSGCIVFDSENGTVIGIHKGIDVKGSTNKCHTFRNESVVILHTQKPSDKSLN